MPALTIIIVNWNSAELLSEALVSLNNALFEEKVEVIVVDNHSDDESLKFDKSKLDLEIKVILSSENLGFGRACNLASKEAKGKYILLMNPDTSVKENTLRDIYNFAESHPEFGIIGTRMEKDGVVQRSCARSPKFLNVFWSTSGLAKIFPQYFPGIIMEDWDHSESKEVEHVIGAFYLIKCDLFKRLNGFDERFFLYYEDLDLSRRARLMGEKIYYWTGLSVYHEGGGTSKSVKDKRLFYSLRSRTQFVKKHFSYLAFFIYWLTQYTMEFSLRLCLAFAKLSKRDVLNLLRAYKWLLMDKDSGIRALI
jgi:N-acetylglucosaminyl-diphospho-decaprenol L-rhamnosyltransferase